MGTCIQGDFGKISVECPKCYHVQTGAKFSVFTCEKCGTKSIPAHLCPVCESVYIRYAMCCNKCTPLVGRHINGPESIGLINKMLEAIGACSGMMEQSQDDTKHFDEAYGLLVQCIHKFKLRIIQTTGVLNGVDLRKK